MSHGPNDLLRAARLAQLSPSGSGRRLSRADLAEAVNAWTYAAHGRVTSLNHAYVGKLERGTHRWPSALTRSALRAVLNVRTDAEIGLFIIRTERLPVEALPAAVVDVGGTDPVTPPTQPLTPDASPRHHLGAELRRWREERGRSLQELAQTVHVSADLLRKVERAERRAHSHVISACDDALSTGGALGRLLTLIERAERRSAPERPPAAAEVVIQVVVELLPRRRRAERDAPSPDTGARIYQFPIGGREVTGE